MDLGYRFLIGVVIGCVLGKLVIILFGNPLIWLDDKWREYKFKKLLNKKVKHVERKFK